MQRSAVVCSVAMDTKTDLQFMKFLSLPLSLVHTHTPPFCLHSLCSQIQHCDSLANKKPPYLPFSGTFFQQATFYNIQVEKIKNKGGGRETAVTQKPGCNYCPLSSGECSCHEQARLSKMSGIGLTESAPFTASFFSSSLAALLSPREGSHSSRLPLYSRLGFSPAESLVGPKVTLLSDKQWLSLSL